MASPLPEVWPHSYLPRAGTQTSLVTWRRRPWPKCKSYTFTLFHVSPFLIQGSPHARDYSSSTCWLSYPFSAWVILSVHQYIITLLEESTKTLFLCTWQQDVLDSYPLWTEMNWERFIIKFWWETVYLKEFESLLLDIHVVVFLTNK